MSTADDAYREAEALIANTHNGPSLILGFRDEVFRALETLPPAIAGLTQMRSLYLENTRVSDLAPIAGLTGLEFLGLSNTQVGDIAPLSGLSRVETLYLDNTRVSDLTPLTAGTLLRSLLLNETLVSDIAPLSELLLLGVLHLNNTQVVDLAPLERLTALNTLQISGTRVHDLSPLAGLTDLRALQLSNTRVTDLAPLARLTGLSALGLDNTQVLDLRPLRGLQLLADMPREQGLTFAGTPATRDPRIAEIAAIEDPKARAAALFALIDAGWMPPGTEKPARSSEPFLFLSYSSQNRPRIAGLRDFLHEQGMPVWWDQDIPPGAGWSKMIAERLRDARAVVTFWTADSVASDAVVEEARRAQAQGKLVPVRLDDAALPYGFGETQYVDLSGWDGTATHPQMRKLLQALRDKLDPPDAERMAARLMAASPVAIVVKDGKAHPVDTPPNVAPEVVNAPELAQRIEGMKQTLGPLQDMASDRANFQFPPELAYALAGVFNVLHAPNLSWYGIFPARDTLLACMEYHDAAGSWNPTMATGLNLLTSNMNALRPLLQPRQVPVDEPGAKPPEPEPVVREADIPEVAALADETETLLNSPEAQAAIDPAGLDLVRREIARIREGAAPSEEPSDERVRFPKLRKGVKGLVYATGAFIGAVGSGVMVSLLTAPEAALTLAKQLQPIVDRLVQFFL